MLEKLKGMLAEQLDISEDMIRPESRFREDLEADSLDLFEMITSLEEELEIEIPVEDVENIATVGDVIDYLRGRGVEL